MPASNELIAFPLLALAVLVFVAVAIVGGEVVRKLVLTVFGSWMGPARPELDSGLDPPAQPPPETRRVTGGGAAGEP